MFWYQSDFPVGVLSFPPRSLSVFILSGAIPVLCCELLGCCTFVCTSPYFQREARLCFTSLINEKFNCYKKYLDKDRSGVEDKHSAFTSPAWFHSQECWVWVWTPCCCYSPSWEPFPSTSLINVNLVLILRCTLSLTHYWYSLSATL